jgi:aminocarboxymuconate-semialdehyde decarboxylase
MVSFYEQRIMVFHSAVKTGAGEELKKGLTKAPIEYYKMMYADTALYGNAPALMLACSFFGVDHLLFATDFPFGGLLGERATKQTIAAIEEMDISDVDKRKIFEDNARRLMHLTI